MERYLPNTMAGEVEKFLFWVEPNRYGAVVAAAECDSGPSLEALFATSLPPSSLSSSVLKRWFLRTLVQRDAVSCLEAAFRWGVGAPFIGFDDLLELACQENAPRCVRAVRAWAASRGIAFDYGRYWWKREMRRLSIELNAKMVEALFAGAEGVPRRLLETCVRTGLITTRRGVAVTKNALGVGPFAAALVSAGCGVAPLRWADGLCIEACIHGTADTVCRLVLGGMTADDLYGRAAFSYVLHHAAVADRKKAAPLDATRAKLTALIGCALSDVRRRPEFLHMARGMNLLPGRRRSAERIVAADIAAAYLEKAIPAAGPRSTPEKTHEMFPPPKRRTSDRARASPET